MTILVSFDIDGTLETGNPPGPVTLDMVRKALDHGCIIGSCSDRPVPVQQGMWDFYQIPVSFTSPKQFLLAVRFRFTAEKYYHIGDSELDRQYALEAGFEFLWMHDGHTEPWLNGSATQR